MIQKITQKIAIKSKKELNDNYEGPTILKFKVVKVIKDTWRKKVTGDNNIPTDIIKVIKEPNNGMKIMANKWYSLKDFLEVTIIVLLKKN